MFIPQLSAILANQIAKHNTNSSNLFKSALSLNLVQLFDQYILIYSNKMHFKNVYLIF